MSYPVLLMRGISIDEVRIYVLLVQARSRSCRFPHGFYDIMHLCNGFRMTSRFEHYLARMGVFDMTIGHRVLHLANGLWCDQVLGQQSTFWY
jgi:hypothetical protein